MNKNQEKSSKLGWIVKMKYCAPIEPYSINEACTHKARNELNKKPYKITHHAIRYNQLNQLKHILFIAASQKYATTAKVCVHHFDNNFTRSSLAKWCFTSFIFAFVQWKPTAMNKKTHRNNGTNVRIAVRAYRIKYECENIPKSRKRRELASSERTHVSDRAYHKTSGLCFQFYRCSRRIMSNAD